MLESYIKERAKISQGPDGKEYRALMLKDTKEISALCNLKVKDVEIAALKNNIIPEKYQRSMGSVGGPQGQIKLLNAKAAIIGAGGLGGSVIELAARTGLGSLVVLDGDVFSDSNLNRQLLSTEEKLGVNKAEEAADRIASINSAVEVTSYSCFATEDNLQGVLPGCDVVIDCLDNLPSRYIVEGAAKSLGIPFIHGAIAQHLGQLTTVFPEDKGLARIYQHLPQGQDKGIEKELGNPATTPTLIAALQVQEAIKVILGRENILRNRLLLVDIENGTMDTLIME